MVKNRLAELQNGSSRNAIEDRESAEMKPLKIDLSESTSDFFATFDENVVGNIDKIRRNVDTIEGLHKKILISVRADEKEAAENRLKDLVEENKRLSRKIQTTLKAEKAKVDEGIATDKSKSKKSSDSRRQLELKMRQTQIDSQWRRFYDIWNEYNFKQAKFRETTKEHLVRQCKIANNSLSDTQIEEMLDEGKTEVFNECILSQMTSARQQLTELQDRHDEFIKLEKSIREVHEMFLEISNLVTQQGELVDNIEHNIQESYKKVEDGRSQLAAAEKHRKSARRKKLICGAILFVVLLIIILVVLGEFGIFSGSSSSSSGGTNLPILTDQPPSSTSTSITSTREATETSTELEEKEIPEP